MINTSLKPCIYKSRCSVPNAKLFPVRSVPHKKWSDQQMKKAIMAIEHEGISLRQVAEMSEIP